jgi:hypothetical protein
MTSTSADDRRRTAFKRLETPRAAAVAGILFAVLFSTSMILIRLSIPEDLTQTGLQQFQQQGLTPITIALALFPFAGVAFLWFMGVLRDRLGRLEDQFFSTVFVGAGLLFLALMFVAAAIAGGVLTSYSLLKETSVAADVHVFARAIMYAIINIYAIRMAGVFMISLGTVWLRTGSMPRLFVFLTYGLALILLVAINLSLWLILVFPAWVFLISVYFLATIRRREKAGLESGAAEGI